MPTATSISLAYLVELLDPFNGEVLECDVCAKLELALEKVYEHFRQYPEVAPRVEVSFDDDDELEGVGFFDSEHEIVSCVTVYHLERDDGETRYPGLLAACQAGRQHMEASLNQVFSR